MTHQSLYYVGMFLIMTQFSMLIAIGVLLWNNRIENPKVYVDSRRSFRHPFGRVYWNKPE